MRPRFSTINRQLDPSPAFWISTGSSSPLTTAVHSKAAGSGKPVRNGGFVGVLGGVLVGELVGVDKGSRVGFSVGEMAAAVMVGGDVGEG
jgi:hypothetical protein